MSIDSPTEEEPGSRIFKVKGFENPAFDDELQKTIEIPALKDMDVLYLPVGLNSIDDEAFMGSACQAVIVPEGCESIASMAFADCPNLIYARVPAGAVIAGDAFGDSVIIDRKRE